MNAKTTTIQLQKTTWKILAKMRIDGNYATFDDLIVAMIEQKVKP